MVEIQVFEFSCECYTGFEGDTCENEVPCELLPCQNGATCSHVFGSTYQCLNCPANYTGLNCDVLIPCSVDPCARGTCSNTDDFLDFECECPEFYVGETCADIGLCTIRDYLLVAAGQAVYDSYEDTCRNNGVCTNSNTTADVSLPFLLDGQFVQITTSDFTIWLKICEHKIVEPLFLFKTPYLCLRPLGALWSPFCLRPHIGPILF